MDGIYYINVVFLVAFIITTAFNSCNKIQIHKTTTNITITAAKLMLQQHHQYSVFKVRRHQAAGL